ncbi:MAG: glycosyltransferase family 2 protein [Salinivirgaceae bacterium]|nr:glycosyltransferase family 2 protein [Salinivirgaceae bacterium]
MIVSICALAKMENAYINHWIAYHLGIGYDLIYIYDNNDADYPLLAEAIEPQLRDRVVIEDWRGRKFPYTPNCQVYNDFFKKHATETDWCTFIDIDEFVHLESNNIKTFLSAAPDTANVIGLNWRIFGDDGVIDGDESVPVYERIKNEVKNNTLNSIYKSTVRCGAVEAIAVSPHSFKTYDETANVFSSPALYDGEYNAIAYDTHKVFVPQARLDTYKNYVAHYMTKTLAEFLRYKCRRVCPSWNFADNIDYFFMINERTAEKEEFINNFK